MSPFLAFLKAALKNPLQTSTPFESSPRVGRRFASQVHLREDQVVVELGVGAGAVTEELLKVLKSPKQYVGFELNDDLYKYLHKQKFPDLEIHHASAEELKTKIKGRKVGAVVSTLPWSLIPKDVRHNILSQIFDVLDEGGTFSVFIAMHVLWAPSTKNFWSELEAKFPRYTYVDELLNVPPCRLYFARK
jgi:phosphatidylethanolamine/phosphatidyl-N-methylethanolamine N-methyltransferase